MSYRFQISCVTGNLALPASRATVMKDDCSTTSHLFQKSAIGNRSQPQSLVQSLRQLRRSLLNDARGVCAASISANSNPAVLFADQIGRVALNSPTRGWLRVRCGGVSRLVPEGMSAQ